MFSDRLKLARKRAGLSLRDLADKLDNRVSAQAIVRQALREDVQRDLFADPQQSYRDAVQFYRHDVDWANRLILGDSLQVMASLAEREQLKGKVQMIYLDPPYGIKFASNFQPEVGKRDVKDKEEDLTREPEMVKAYRDTWTLGIHSYLAYLRDRLAMARELLTDSGSIFAVLRSNQAAADILIIGGCGNTAKQFQFSTTTISPTKTCVGQAINPAYSWPIGATHEVAWIQNLATYVEVRADGRLVASGVPAVSGYGTGALNVSNSTASGMDLAELLWFDSALTAQNITSVECYLGARYGTTTCL